MRSEPAPDLISAVAADKPYTTKQMGDACEMLIAGELTLAGVPAMKVPDIWPGYDVVAHPPGGKPLQRISVKSRTVKTTSNYVAFDPATSDWLAIVLLVENGRRQFFIVPSELAHKHAFSGKYLGARNPCALSVATIRKVFADYRDNFELKRYDR
jgi:hypothetical protein